jgi:hypothetical protein
MLIKLVWYMVACGQCNGSGVQFGMHPKCSMGQVLCNWNNVIGSLAMFCSTGREVVDDVEAFCKVHYNELYVGVSTVSYINRVSIMIRF